MQILKYEMTRNIQKICCPSGEDIMQKLRQNSGREVFFSGNHNHSSSIVIPSSSAWFWYQMRCEDRKTPPAMQEANEGNRSTQIPEIKSKRNKKRDNANNKQKNVDHSSTAQIRSPGPMPVGKSLNGRPSMGLLNSRLW